MRRPVVVLILTTILILTISSALIFQAKGYKFDFKNKKIEKTGIIAISSTPTGAAVYLNNKLTSATNTNLSDLPPGEYQVKVNKDGYLPWEKKVIVEPELVIPLEITLFPSAPDLRPLTFTGVNNPQLSPDGQKIAYSLKNGDKSGIWILDLTDRPLNFSRDPKQISRDTDKLAFSNSQFSWTPDSKTILSVLIEKKTYLLNADQLNNDSLVDVSATIESTKKIWEEDKLLKNQDRLSRLLTDSGRKLASSSAQVHWAPDESKFLALGDKSKDLVYDGKKGKVFEIPKAKKHVWYPDSRHLILVEDKSISIVEYTGENTTSIYSGNFDENVIFPWANGSKLVIAASFNPSIKEPNLYAINLR